MNMPHTLICQALPFRGGTVSGLRLQVHASGAKARLGLYADDDGGPGALLGQSDSFAAVEGSQLVPLTTPLELAAGTIFVGILAEDFLRLSHAGGDADIHHRGHAFGALDAHAGEPATVESHLFDIAIVTT